MAVMPYGGSENKSYKNEYKTPCLVVAGIGVHEHRTLTF